MPTDEARHQRLRSLAGELTELRDDEILEVLRHVFAVRTPYPEEAQWHRSRYFLGIASSILEDEFDPVAGKELWGKWTVSAAAYPDGEQYGTWRGPGDGFAEAGECQSCHMDVQGIRKHGICPVCGGHVYMT